jgi:hypothetical protein
MIEDSKSQKVLAKFYYSLESHFKINKKTVNLNSKNPIDEVKIETSSKLNITQKNGDKKWLQSQYDTKKGIQNIKIDMRG